MAVARVTVSFEEGYFYPSDGGQIWLSGYQPVDERTGSFLARDAAALAERDLHVAGVAGATHQPEEALQDQAFEPGRQLTLRRDPGNEHDPNAIAVEAAGGPRAGWVPRETAAAIAPRLDAGETWSGLVLRDRRASPRDPRTGFTMLLAPAEAIELVEYER